MLCRRLEYKDACCVVGEDAARLCPAQEDLAEIRYHGRFAVITRTKRTLRIAHTPHVHVPGHIHFHVHVLRHDAPKDHYGFNLEDAVSRKFSIYGGV